MNVFDLIKTANANLLRNKGRSILTILAIFIGSFTIAVTTGINTGVNDYIDKQLESAGGRGYIEILPAATMESMTDALGGGGVSEYNPEKSSSVLQGITEKEVEEIKAIDGMISAQKGIRVESEYIVSNKSETKYVISVNELPSDNINIDMTSGQQVNVSADKNEITLLSEMAEALGYDDESILGEAVRVAVRNKLGGEIIEIEAKVVGVQNPSLISRGQAWINRGLKEELYEAATKGLPESIKEQVFYVTGEFDQALTDEQVNRLKEDLKEVGFVGMTVFDQVNMIKSLFDAVTNILIIFGAIALLAASIGIINTLFMAVQERTREIGLMKAIGLSGGKIRLMFSFEAIMLGFWGSLVGIVGAFGAGIIANGIAETTFLEGLPGFTLVKFNVINLVVMVTAVMLIAFLAGTLPARRASKLDPINALRYE